MKDLRNTDNIYIADQRICWQNDEYRVVSTFNYGALKKANKEPIVPLFLVNDCSVKAGSYRTERLNANTQHIFIPIIGELVFKSNQEAQEILMGQILYMHTTNEDNCRISSRILGEAFTFLHIALESATGIANRNTHHWQIPLDTQKECWITPTTTIENADFHFSIGVFNSHQDFFFWGNCAFNNRFIFVIEGAVEIDHKLLYAGDALHVTDRLNLTMEALCPYSILFVLQF